MPKPTDCFHCDLAALAYKRMTDVADFGPEELMRDMGQFFADIVNVVPTDQRTLMAAALLAVFIDEASCRIKGVTITKFQKGETLQ